MTNPTACIIVIGNEILSGRTHDQNTHYLAGELTKIGITVSEARVIPDNEAIIIRTIEKFRQRADYVFTTGGIGPTHDDITTKSVADYFQVELELHPEAHQRLKDHYGAKLNEARLKMALIPEGATLIDNPVSAAPGFVIDNVYVMAGVPRIMQAMFDSMKHTLKGGAPVLSETITVDQTEGDIADALSAVQIHYPNVEIGSYPFMKDGKLGTSVVLRSADAQLLAKVVSTTKQSLKS